MICVSKSHFLSRLGGLSLLLLSLYSPVVQAGEPLPQSLYQRIEAGLQRALKDGKIVPNSALHQAVAELLTQLAGGAVLESATQRTGVFPTVALTLARWGESSLPIAAAIPPKPAVALPPGASPAVPTPQPSQPERATIPVNSHTLANALVRGLAVANRTGEIGYQNALSLQVQSLIRYLRRGSSLEAAMKRTRLPQQTVERLLQLGGYAAG